MFIAKPTLKAAGIHLCISAAVAALGVTLLQTLWYPPPYFYGQGAQELLFILLSVDVTIGPLCTLVVYNNRKPRKELVRDLGVIAALQLAALLYGGYVAFASRPVYTVLMDNSRFVVTTAPDIRPEDLAKVTRPEFKTLPLTGPVLVAADPPIDTDSSSWNDKLQLSLKRLGGDSEQYRPQEFVPYSERRAQALAHAKPLGKLRDANPENGARLDDYLRQSGRNEDSLRYLPLHTRLSVMSVLIDATSGDFVTLLPLESKEDAGEVPPPKAKAQ